MEDGALAGDGGRGGLAAVQPPGQRIQGATDHRRVGQAGEGSERRRAQASACSIWAGGWLPARPGLNAQRYSAARSTAGGGLRHSW